MEQYFATKNMSKANDLYLTMMTKSNSAGLNQLAYFYANNKDIPSNFVKAQAAIDRAIELTPDDYNYLDSKGEIYLIEGQEKKAKKIWKSILKNKPTFYNYVEAGYHKSVLNKYFSNQNK